MIYLDYTAHMPVCRQALDAFVEAETQSLGNANARHCAGTSANQRMEKALLNVSDLLKISPQEAIFYLRRERKQQYRYSGRRICQPSLWPPYHHISPGAPICQRMPDGFAGKRV